MREATETEESRSPGGADDNTADQKGTRMITESMNRREQMKLEAEILEAYIDSLDWSQCNEDPEDFFINNFDPDEYDAFYTRYLEEMK